ncbi:GNAT family N-acetyltransferase [Phytomonospora endophytica]|uniref:GNAT superfamily N-acetyltransferase n=1 Tax=Phytomonospora endophytica TaxID=714109 RepID=A0A841FNU9_9ACTN|nr:GNAT family N-acetyltransferase [Phytomonospora endophytica]MBB6037776.1 GNAT superfamily N-acetyltransferase [Phytomonospora endophytica]
MDLTPLVRRWLAAWTIARELGPAVDVPGGFRVTLGLPGRHHEFMAPDAAGLPALVTALKAIEPSWLTAFTTDPAATEVALKAEGLEFFTDAETFMRTDLDGRPKRRPAEGYTVATTVDGPLIRAAVTAPDGTAAASGLMAVAGTDAVAHGIQTDEAHRRRGLGGAVMTALGEAATARGATTGLLIASAAGEGLYRSMGWETLATVVTVRA